MIRQLLRIVEYNGKHDFQLAQWSKCHENWLDHVYAGLVRIVFVKRSEHPVLHVARIYIENISTDTKNERGVRISTHAHVRQAHIEYIVCTTKHSLRVITTYIIIIHIFSPDENTARNLVQGAYYYYCSMWTIWNEIDTRNNQTEFNDYVITHV